MYKKVKKNKNECRAASLYPGTATRTTLVNVISNKVRTTNEEFGSRLRDLAGLDNYYFLPMWLFVALGAVGGAMGMEYYARYSHEHSWHAGRLWSVHKSHHGNRRRILGIEPNDVLGSLNALAVIPIMLLSYHYLHTAHGAVTFGFSAGVSLFGVAYTFVHDGVHHNRFPTGPLGRLHFIKRVSEAHAHHHRAEMGPPYGLFLGEQELNAAQEGKRPPGMPYFLQALLLGLGAVVVQGAIEPSIVLNWR